MIELVPNPEPRGIEVCVAEFQSAAQSLAQFAHWHLRIEIDRHDALQHQRRFLQRKRIGRVGIVDQLAHRASARTSPRCRGFPESNCGSLNRVASATIGCAPRSVMAAFNTVPPCSMLYGGVSVQPPPKSMRAAALHLHAAARTSARRCCAGYRFAHRRFDHLRENREGAIFPLGLTAGLGQRFVTAQAHDGISLSQPMRRPDRSAARCCSAPTRSAFRASAAGCSF